MTEATIMGLPLYSWPMVHSIGRLLIVALVTVKTTRFSETLNAVERVGLGMTGGGALLSIDVIWKQQQSPFADWSIGLIIYGTVLFLAGRTWRDRRHEINGWRAKRAARRHLQMRGRL